MSSSRSRSGARGAALVANLLFLTVVAATRLHAQDTVRGVFRETISHVASVAGWKDLRTDDDVVREIRVYQGFGIAIPNSVFRLWEGADGRAHAQMGYFWAPPNSGAGEDGGDYDREVRALMDTAYACTDFRRSAEENVCLSRGGLTESEDASLAAALWALGLQELRTPSRASLGLDGWTVVVEYRSRREYRSVSVWQPSASSEDAAVRLVARVGALVAEAAERVRVRAVGR